MKIRQFQAAIVCFHLAGQLLAQSAVEDIANNWSTTTLRRVRVTSARASSTFGEANGGYAPARAIDAQRGTKWVASIAPTPEAPQWIELKLASPQAVSSFALFGEAVNNDGVVDAQVQVQTPGAGAFATVAAVKGARSASWRATFPPVTAAAVRLLITRSGGPTTHTDVYEVEIHGPRLGAAELEDYVRNTFSHADEHFRQAREQSRAWPTNAWFKSLRQDLADLASPLAGASRRLLQWRETGEQEREELAATVERLDEQVGRVAERVKALAAHAPVLAKMAEQQAAEVRAARALVARAGAGDPAATARDGHTARLFNRHVLVCFDEVENDWDITWLGAAEAAVHRARFSAEWDGQATRPAHAKITVGRFIDPLGAGQEILQQWDGAVKLERRTRVYDGLAWVTISGRIVNAGAAEISLGTFRLLEAASEGQAAWQLGPPVAAPGAVFIGGTSDLLCQPPSGGDLGTGGEQAYSSTGILALATREPAAALVLGYLTAYEARPDLSARFRPLTGGTALSAHQRFLGRKLRPGEALDLDVVCLAADSDPHAALEQYGAAAARFAQAPIRRQPTALWCSWYAHRMAMTEDLVLANAAIAARHFQPLGLEIMQLDHGWQRGDITGDWIPNERFPHGLKWLAGELKKRHGLRLGVWIAPTDVAETSALFQQHRDWLLQDEKGVPRVNWRWYWKPNPNCYELDASHPAAAAWMEQVFAQLSAWGVSYYKIDFIASAGGEHFFQHDPQATRGWTPLRRAMEALRKGAGPEAWIRYCQTPPLLSAGLADSTIGGGDTLDAGLNGRIDVLRDNARHLAAGYWLNDRLYHREVCDMSVRMQAGVEEARLRLAMMTLAGCSISFSDELQYLPPSRIRLMQQCLPPGNPPMRPLDLFERTIPSLWHLHCRNGDDEWEVAGLFNFENQPEERTLDLAALGLPPGAEVAGFEFWEERFLGVHRGSLSLTLPPQSCRVVSLRRLAGRPQLVGTDLHLLQGFHEIRQLQWDPAAKALSGTYHRMPGMAGKAFFHLPEGWFPKFEFPLSPASARLTHVEGPIWMQEFTFTGPDFTWTIPFEAPQPPPTREPTGPAAGQ